MYVGGDGGTESLVCRVRLLQMHRRGEFADGGTRAEGVGFLLDEDRCVAAGGLVWGYGGNSVCTGPAIWVLGFIGVRFRGFVYLVVHMVTRYEVSTPCSFAFRYGVHQAPFFLILATSL